MNKQSITGLLAAFALVAMSACSEPAPTATSTNPGATATTVVSDCGPDQLLECARKSTLEPYVPAKITRATGTPITLGMINQENTPAASFPELSKATQTAIDWVNQELGGVDGHPIELEVCNTKFSAEGSTGCGQQFVEEKVPAVLGGIDILGNGIDVLDKNGIPFVGGIPIANQAAVAKNSFQFGGGMWGATIAFAGYAADTLHAKRVSIIYGEFGSITQSAEYGKKVLEDRGVKAQLVPYPILSTDISSALNAAAASKPDAILVLVADTGCKSGFNGVGALGIKAQAFYVGACAAPNILGSVPISETDGAIVNVEGPVSASDIDTVLYGSVVSKYGKELDAASAGTVTFRSFMNLYMVMRQLGADNITPKAIMEAFSKQVDAPSFMGHSYTCDGKQLAGLPALCSPQQILAKISNRKLTQIGTWIDVGKLYGH